MTKDQLAIRKVNTMAILSTTLSSLPVHKVMVYSILESFYCSYYIDYTDNFSRLETFNKLLDLDKELLNCSIIWKYNIEWDDESDTCTLYLHYMSPQLEE